MNVDVNVDLVPANGGEPEIEPFPQYLEIAVGGGDSFGLSDLPIASILTGMVGSAFSVPFFYTLWKERRDKAAPAKATGAR